MKFLALVNNLVREVKAVVTSSGATNDGDIPALDSSGRLDTSMMPVGIGADTKIITASESLSAGDFVNIHDVSGTANVRKADANDATKPAHGFVLDTVASAADATVYFEGANTKLSGLTAGKTYVLSAATPGDVVERSSAPSADGNILQVVGVATDASEINTEIGNPIVRSA